MKKPFWGLAIFTLGVAIAAFAALIRAPKAILVVIPGHWGSDPGAVCPDGLEERAVNFRIASILAESLRGKGYEVQLLPEFSSRVKLMRPALFLSIHSDSCIEGKSGFKLVARGGRGREAGSLPSGKLREGERAAL